MTDQELREKAIEEVAKLEEASPSEISDNLEHYYVKATTAITVAERAIRAEELLREAKAVLIECERAEWQREDGFWSRHYACVALIDAALNGGAR